MLQQLVIIAVAPATMNCDDEQARFDRLITRCTDRQIIQFSMIWWWCCNWCGSSVQTWTWDWDVNGHHNRNSDTVSKFYNQNMLYMTSVKRQSNVIHSDDDVAMARARDVPNSCCNPVACWARDVSNSCCNAVACARDVSRSCCNPVACARDVPTAVPRRHGPYLWDN